jgi:hypothetical protein
MLFETDATAGCECDRPLFLYMRDAYLGDIQVMTARGKAGPDQVGVEFDPKVFELSTEQIPTPDDARLAEDWGDRLTRIDPTVRGLGTEHRWVLRIGAEGGR